MNFSSRIWLQRLSKTTVLLTLLLIFVGALVKMFRSLGGTVLGTGTKPEKLDVIKLSLIHI